MSPSLEVLGDDGMVHREDHRTSSSEAILGDEGMVQKQEHRTTCPLPEAALALLKG